MIKITSPEPTTKAWKRWRKDVTATVDAMITSTAAGEAIKISQALYKRRKDDLFAPFFNKCAYCECEFIRQNGHVEHYRPKKGVRDLQNKPVSIQVGGAMQAHPGYFWLAYDRMNLLPSCEKCNQQPARRKDGTFAGKGNRFPVAGAHAYNHADPLKTDLTGEQPLLLHPCIDNPDDHLKYLPETGALGWLTPRGEKTIEICDLNNERLCEERREVYTNVLSRFIAAVATAQGGVAGPAEDMEKYGQRYIKGDRPYAMVGRVALAAAIKLVAGK
jgi:hypothetical protein